MNYRAIVLQVLLAGLALVGLNRCVEAHTMTAVECHRAADDIYSAAIDALKGETLEQALKEAKDGLPQCRARTEHPCIYKDAQDDQRVYDFLNFLYSGAPGTDQPGKLALSFYKACMSIAPDAPDASKHEGRTDGPAKETPDTTMKQGEHNL